MANFRISTAAQNALANALATLVDAGATGGTIKIYDGSQPAGPGTAITTQVLLATLTFDATAFGAGAVAGVLTAAAITEDSTADATGTATWARIADSDGTAIFDCDVAAASATINLNTVSIVAGGIVRITSFTITMPAS
jgi:hypothetical protein